LDGYHISFDGALVSSPTTGAEAYAMPLDRALVGQMIDFSHRNGIDLELFSTTHYFSERETWSTEAHRRFFDVEATMADFSHLWQRERIIKGGLVTTKPEDEAWVESFRRHFDGRLHLSRAKTPAYPDVTFINVLNPQVSKGNALIALAGYLGIAPAEVMAAGDGTNDISLLSAAGLAVAMGNAPAEVKAAADYITLDVDHSGLAAAVRKFLLRPGS
ncbi:MAG: HAD hydrolase family protein, partial [Chloroflexota bacterium]